MLFFILKSRAPKWEVYSLLSDVIFICTLLKKKRFSEYKFLYWIKYVNDAFFLFLSTLNFLVCCLRMDGWMDGWRYESNCPLVRPGTIGGVPSVGGFLRDPCPYLREFLRKPPYLEGLIRFVPTLYIQSFFLFLNLFIFQNFDDTGIFQISDSTKLILFLLI